MFRAERRSGSRSGTRRASTTPTRASRRSSGRLSGLPPAMLLAGSSELLLDDTLRLSAKLAGARNAVWHGMPHVFPAIRGLVDGDRAIAEIADFVHEQTSEATRGALKPGREGIHASRLPA